MTMFTSVEYSYELAPNGSMVLTKILSALTAENGDISYVPANEVAIVRPQFSLQFLIAAVKKAEIPLEQITDCPQAVFQLLEKYVGSPGAYLQRHQAFVDLWTTRFQIAAL